MVEVIDDVKTVKKDAARSSTRGTKDSRMVQISLKSFLVAVIVLGAIGSAGYFWNESRVAKQQTTESVADRNQSESEEVIQSLSSVLLLVDDEEPTVARVDDPDALKLSNQSFYKDVQVGDHLVLYAERAIIFRLNEKKIVNVAPILNASDSSEPQVLPEE